MMHIIEIPSFLPPYGGYFCVEQAKALQALGHEVRILLCQQLGVTVYPKHYFVARYGRWREMYDGVEVYRTNMRGVPKFVKVNQQRYCSIVLSMFRKYVEWYGKPDVLHAHCCKWAGVAAMIISAEYSIPYYITEHISIGLYKAEFGQNWERNTWAKSLLREAYEKASCVIPVAAELVDSIEEMFGKNYKWSEVSNVIDTEFYRFANRPPHKGRPYKFCCLANANKEHLIGKGYDVLFEAFNGLTGAELYVAGRSTRGESITSLLKEKVSGDNCRNIHLLGELDREKVRQLLYDCDALVLASRSEVQPLVVLEAMSTGIPVVATECVPLSERIDVACVIVPMNDANGLREGMQKVQDILPSITFSDAVKQLASPNIVARKLERIFADGI